MRSKPLCWALAQMHLTCSLMWAMASTTVVPDNCFPHPDLDLNLHLDANATGMLDCQEEDTMWTKITFACIQLLHLPP